ncbi:30S ribosome-binding factor RbfA [Alsobacter sp. R-9]
MKRDTESRSSGPSQRQLRVGELVRHALTEILARGELPEPALARAFVTIPEVRMSPDLRLATIFVTLHDKREEKAVLQALEANRKHLRGEVAHRVNLKFAPDIRFRIDDRLDEAARIDALLRSPAVQRDIAAPRHDDEE